MMADSSPAYNGESKANDTFEQDLNDILNDGQDLTDVHNTVQSGSPNKIMTSSYPVASSGNFGAQSGLSRSHTMPPGVCFLTLLLTFVHSDLTLYYNILKDFLYWFCGKIFCYFFLYM